MARTTAAQVRAFAARAANATTARDYWIRQMRDEGATLRAIADAAQLSHTAIAKILAR